MKFKRLLVLGASLLTIPMLAGCGNNSVPDDGYLIKVWGTFNDTYGAIVDEAITKMKELHPEYTIRYTKQTGMGYDGLAQAVVKGFSANDYPDAVVAYPDSVADFIYAKRALDIQPYMDDPEIGWSQTEKDDIPDAYMEEGSGYFVAGTFSAPLCKSTEAMYYNRDILINMDLSDIDNDINDGEPLTDEYIQSLTWDELFDKLCPAIMEKNKLSKEQGGQFLNPSSEYEKTWALVGYDSDDNLFITLAEQFGLPYTSLDQTTKQGSVDFVEKDSAGNFTGVSQGYINLMKKFTDAYKKQYFTTKGVVGKNVNYISTTGGMLFSIGSTGGVSYQFAKTNSFDVGVAPVPQFDDESIELINQGPSLAFLRRGEKGSNEQVLRAKGAWMFYDVWSSVAINSKWSQASGYTPIRTSVTNEPSYLRYSNPDLHQEKTLDKLTARNARYAAEHIDDMFSSPVFYGSSKARTAVSGIMADIFKNVNDIDINSDAFVNLVKQYFKKGYDAAI